MFKSIMSFSLFKRANNGLPLIVFCTFLSGCVTQPTQPDNQSRNNNSSNTSTEKTVAQSAPVNIEPVKLKEVALFDNLTPYADIDSACDKPDSVGQKGRWLLMNDPHGIAIDLNNKIMFKRHPLGTKWIAGKNEFTGNPNLYKKPPMQNDDKHLDLPGWHVTSMDEVRGLYVKCKKDDRKYKIFNSKIFPAQSQNNDQYIKTTTPGGDGSTMCGVVTGRHHGFNKDWNIPDETYSKSSGCISGSGLTTGMAYVVRQLTLYEIENYESIFETKIQTSQKKLQTKQKPQQAYVSFLTGDKLNGLFDESGNGNGLMEYFDGLFYYGAISKHLPHGIGVFLNKNGQRFEGIAEFGLFDKMQSADCKLNDDSLRQLLISFGPFYWKPENRNLTTQSSWMGSCVNGAANGAGVVVTKVRTKAYNSRGTIEALFVGTVSMKNGVPFGDYTVTGRTSKIHATTLGEIANGKITRNYVEESRQKSMETIGRLIGQGINYIAKSVAEACKNNDCNNPAPPASVSSGSENPSTNNNTAKSANSYQYKCYIFVKNNPAGFNEPISTIKVQASSKSEALAQAEKRGKETNWGSGSRYYYSQVSCY